MSLIVRLLVIFLGFCFAAFAGGMVLLLALMFPAWGDLAIDGSGPGIMIGLAFIFVSGFALVPAAIIALITEVFAIRSVLAYALGGALTGVLCYLSLVPFDTATWAFSGLVRRHLEVMSGAGIVGGLAYWLVAGRNAGLWRNRV